MHLAAKVTLTATTSLTHWSDGSA